MIAKWTRPDPDGRGGADKAPAPALPDPESPVAPAAVIALRPGQPGARPSTSPGGGFGANVVARLRNLVLAARWRIERLGIFITAYYWCREGCDDAAPPVVEPDHSVFRRYDDAPPPAGMPADFPAERLPHLQKCRERGWPVWVAMDGGRVVAFMSVRFDDGVFYGRRMPIGAGDAYINTVYTVPAFRGHGIAARLRHVCFRDLRAQGIGRIYSCIDALNQPGLRTARKLGLRPLSLTLHIGLGPRFHWHIPLRRYPAEG